VDLISVIRYLLPKKPIAPNSTSTNPQRLPTGELPMLNQLTQSNKLSQLILTAGLCLATVLAIQIVGVPTGGNRPVTKATEKNLNENGFILNGTSFNGLRINGTSLNGANLNGTSFNSASLNGTGLNANGVHFKKFGSTSPTFVTATLNQKPISKINLEGGQLALKIKRSD
jgi:uncharacterized protein YjbI with pentapeptide repeats